MAMSQQGSCRPSINQIIAYPNHAVTAVKVVLFCQSYPKNSETKKKKTLEAENKVSVSQGDDKLVAVTPVILWPHCILPFMHQQVPSRAVKCGSFQTTKLTLKIIRLIIPLAVLILLEQ